MSAERFDAAEKKKILTTSFITIFINVIGIGLVIPTVSILFLNNPSPFFTSGVTDATRKILLGIFFASFPIAQFFGAPLLGQLSDRFGRKPMLLVSLYGTLAAYIMTAMGIILGDIWLLFLSRLLDGITGGNISIINSTIADVSTGAEKRKNFGLVGAAFGLGFIFGPFIGGKLSDPNLVHWFSFSTPFWFAAGITALNIILAYRIYRETLSKEDKEKSKKTKGVNPFSGIRNISKAFVMKDLRNLLLMFFVFVLGFTFFTQFFQVYLIDVFRFNQSQIGDFFAIFGIFGALSQGFLVRRLSNKIPTIPTLTVTMLGFSVLLLIALIPRNILLLYLVVVVLAIVQAFNQPNITALISDSADYSRQGEILGVQQSVRSFAMAIPPLAAGVLSAISPALPTIVASACALMGWLIFVLVIAPRIRRGEHPASKVLGN